jgi:hypothetical protein
MERRVFVKASLLVVRVCAAMLSSDDPFVLPIQVIVASPPTRAASMEVGGGTVVGCRAECVAGSCGGWRVATVDRSPPRSFVGSSVRW